MLYCKHSTTSKHLGSPTPNEKAVDIVQCRVACLAYRRPQEWSPATRKGQKRK